MILITELHPFLAPLPYLFSLPPPLYAYVRDICHFKCDLKSFAHYLNGSPLREYPICVDCTQLGKIPSFILDRAQSVSSNVKYTVVIPLSVTLSGTSRSQE